LFYAKRYSIYTGDMEATGRQEKVMEGDGSRKKVMEPYGSL